MSNDKKTIEKLTSRVKIYLVIIALLFILICTYDIKWVIPSIVLYILIILYTMWSNTKKKTEIETHIEEVAWGMNSTVRNTLNKSSIPLLVIETDGDVIFRNPKFNKEFKDVDVITYVDSLIKEIKLEIENNNDKKEITKQISIENKVYKVMCEYTISKKRDKRKQKEYVLTLNFIDETKYNELFDKYINEKLCIGIAVIDNYEEIIQKLSPEEKTAVLAKIEKTMFDWASTSGGVVIKNERDTYIYIFEQKYLAEIEKNKISEETIQEPVNKIIQVSSNVISSRSEGTSRGKITGTVSEYQEYARERCSAYGWSDGDFGALVKLWNRESGWNPNTRNSSSGAYGIPQALPASKMASAGSDYMTNYKTQINWGLSYISSRYGSPSSAWSYFQSNGWY